MRYFLILTSTLRQPKLKVYKCIQYIKTQLSKIEADLWGVIGLKTILFKRRRSFNKPKERHTLEYKLAVKKIDCIVYLLELLGQNMAASRGVRRQLSKPCLSE